MNEAELVDLGSDPVEARRAARRRVSRVIAPIAAAVVLVASVIGLLAVGYESNRRGALALSDDVLTGLEQRIESQTALWLGTASRALTVLHDVLADRVFEGDERTNAEHLAKHLLRNVQSLSLMSLAGLNGNYMLLRRNEAGGVDTKTILNDPAPRTVTWTRRDAQGNVIGVEEDPTDTFDPRTRPWYIAAVATDQVAWTTPYVFFTDRVPGLTAALAFREGETVRAVFGVDIRLDALSTFLANLSIGSTGRGIIVDRTGRIVAAPDSGATVREVNGELIRPRLDELGDPVLLRAYSLLRVNGHGRYTFTLDAKAHIAIWSQLQAVGDGSWSMLITVPEEEFVGFVGTSSRLTAVVGAVVVAVALLLALLLVRQGLRGDRMERMIERRQRSMAAQTATLARLARAPAVHDPARDEGVALLTASLADTLHASRTSMWRLGSARDSLRCEDIYDTTGEAHAAGLRLRKPDHPAFFAALATGEPFDTADAAADPRSVELHRAVLHETDTRGLLCVPVFQGTTLLGALLVEDRDRALIPEPQAIGFALAISGIAAARLAAMAAARTPSVREQQPLALRADERAATQLGSAPQPVTALPSASLPAPSSVHAEGSGVLTLDRSRTLTRELFARGLDQRGLAAEVFPSVTVMVLTFSDPLALAEPVARSGGCSLADELMRMLQDVASNTGVGYLRVMGDTVIAADGFGDRADAATSIIADAALEIAERCERLFASLDHGLGFRIGIDTGAVIGSTVGDAVRTYNIWGEAVHAAEAMAASAPPGTIHISEATHARLAQHFMFRPRGRFWIPGAGEMATFLLAGRA